MSEEPLTLDELQLAKDVLETKAHRLRMESHALRYGGEQLALIGHYCQRSRNRHWNNNFPDILGSRTTAKWSEEFKAEDCTSYWMRDIDGVPVKYVEPENWPDWMMNSPNVVNARGGS